ncbi:MAG: SRPBCC family protein [Chitinophagaceae bacterium]|nr:SRPBCC family protein [Chitinophagaceae bacterium]
MRIVKKILIGVVVLAAALLIIALFVKKDFSAEREITINKSSQEVFNYIRYLKNQDSYSVWAKMDPDMKKTYHGADGAVGFVSAWEGNSEVGKGEQKITKITDGQRMDFELHFIKPFESISPAYMTTEAISATQTKVKWGMSGKIVYPFNIMGLFMNMDEAIGKDFKTGLDNLKVVLEK